MNQIRFRLVRHLKMTVWTSVLWKIIMQLANKWPERVIKWPFILSDSFPIRVYDPQSAGINVQSPQSELTPRRLTLLDRLPHQSTQKAYRTLGGPLEWLWNWLKLVKSKNSLSKKGKKNTYKWFFSGKQNFEKLLL